MQEPLAQLAAYFRRRSTVPDAELVRLTAEARAAGSRWDAIAAACGVRTYEDAAGIVFQPSGTIAGTGAWLLYRATQYSNHKLVLEGCCYPPLSWPCTGCGQQITDRAATGRPVHIEHGHTPGCSRLARDQTADAYERREWLPRMILHSEPARGPVQRHWLRERIEDDCPRCGWHGYFHYYIATIDDDWSVGVCDNCYADLHPDIGVRVKFFSARSPGDGKAVAVIRQRARSDRDYPDLGYLPDTGQEITRQLSWQHTTMLIDDRCGNCIEVIAEISRSEAEQIAAELAAQHWPPHASRLPWVVSAYPA